MTACRCKDRIRAFTLIEMLVVVLIIGLSIGLVGAVARPDDRALLRVEAERLAQLLALAGEQANISGKGLAWTADAAGYRFWQEKNGQWVDFAEDGQLRPRFLPQGMVLSGLQVENRPRQIMRLEFFPHAPSAVFLLAMTLGSQHLRIDGSPLGDVAIAADQGESDGAMAGR